MIRLIDNERSAFKVWKDSKGNYPHVQPENATYETNFYFKAKLKYHSTDASKNKRYFHKFIDEEGIEYTALTKTFVKMSLSPRWKKGYLNGTFSFRKYGHTMTLMYIGD